MTGYKRESVYMCQRIKLDQKVNPGIEHDILQGGKKKGEMCFKRSRFDWDIAQWNVSRIHRS